ncbi:hypothetical protein GZ77_12160 [Endozoicomonas montiporae]|uniref:Uncharacterized protein n=1 Tax=Endozoicomonas montiporae TaxID=1027273 RepID=A0A081N960_9GAMM|nr:hypothetical protein GZ77_12160 [Endozoicomonas montiporae]
MPEKHDNRLFLLYILYFDCNNFDLCLLQKQQHDLTIIRKMFTKLDSCHFVEIIQQKNNQK